MQGIWDRNIGIVAVSTVPGPEKCTLVSSAIPISAETVATNSTDYYYC